MVDFLEKVTSLLHQFAGSDLTEVCLLHRSRYLVGRCVKEGGESGLELIPDHATTPGSVVLLQALSCEEPKVSPLLRTLLSPQGNLVLNNAAETHRTELAELWPGISELGPSLAVLRIGTKASEGTVTFSSLAPNFFLPVRVESLERLAEMLATAVASRNAQAALRERIKELTCLYQIALSIEEPHRSLGEVLQSVVDVLPAAWLYPEDLWARLTIDEDVYRAGKEVTKGERLQSPVTVMGRSRGCLEVGYARPRPVLDEGPFLSEERRLLDTIAREVALIIERKEMEENSRKLHDQLLHAERLATIGEFSASIAHELNEPLASILGFSQLASKSPGLPAQAAGDLEKITGAVLHAREILQQLLLFARRLPSRREPLALNEVVEANLSFLRALCVEKDVAVSQSLDPELPPIVGDRGQLRQLLVNLVANATQAMPDGGELSISTAWEERSGVVCLAVADTGVGMTEDVQEKAFIPFFTTKEETGGTGLGLSVVHGIVTAHGGTVQVESRPGEGSRFEVRIPVRGED